MPVDTGDILETWPMNLPFVKHPAVAGPSRILLLGAALSTPWLTGCQVDVGGQTLPSAYYLQDDIQYFPAGPEFKLSREAAAQKAYRRDVAADEACCPSR